MRDESTLRYDAVVVGGGFAGLSAALQIARARRSVCVVDAGRPRNRFAAASHGFFSRDGAAPLDMLAAARDQLLRYPTATILSGEVLAAAADADGFELRLENGADLRAKGVALAFGVSDSLPPAPGLAERWGVSVLHCPYCHGYEYSGRRLGVLWNGPASVHRALLIAQWGPVTLFLDGAEAPDAPSLQSLAQRAVAIEPAPVRALEGDGASLSAVRLGDGRAVAIDALYVAPRAVLNSPLAERLGCAVDEGPFGPMIRTDEWKRASVAGVFAAGDIARAPHNASWAAADGVTAGVGLHQWLTFAGL